MVAVLLVVVGPARPTTLLPPRSNGKPEAATAVDKLLMMGMRMPEICWAVFKRQAINLRDWCIWLVDLFEDIQVWWLTLLRQPQEFCEECNVLDTDPCCILLFTFHSNYLPGCWQVLSPTTPQIIDKIYELILEERRISAKSIAEQLGNSHERVGSTIHEDLDMPVVCILPGRAKDLSAPLYYSDIYSASYAHRLWAE